MALNYIENWSAYYSPFFGFGSNENILLEEHTFLSKQPGTKLPIKKNKKHHINHQGNAMVVQSYTFLNELFYYK